MLLYMKQSLKRRFGMHAHVFIIMVCAFILPLLFCFIRDSMLYGAGGRGKAISNNSYYIMNGAQPHHVEYFKDFEGLKAVYEDGAIYFQATDAFDESKVAPLLEWDENGFSATVNRFASSYVPTYDDELMDIARTITDAFLLPSPLVGVRTVNSSTIELFNQYLIFIVVLILLAVLVQYVMYSLHIANFCPEVGALRCMGASKRQIRRLFLLELLFLFFSAGIVAFALSYIIGYVMLNIFMRIDNFNTNLMWTIFHIEPTNVLIIYGTMFVFAILIYVVKMRGVLRLNPQELALYSSSQKLRHYRKKLVLNKNAVKSVSSVLLARASKGFVRSLAVAVPAVAVLILALNYVGTQIASAYIAPPFDIRVYATGDMANGEGFGFSEEDMNYLDALDGVQSINYLNTDGTDRVFVEQRGNIQMIMGQLMNGFYVDDKPVTNVTIHPIDRLNDEYITEEIKNALRENPYMVVMDTDTDYMQYAAGDSVSVYKYSGDDSELFGVTSLSSQNFAQPLQLTVGALIDITIPTQTEIYVSQAVYNQLVDKSDSNVAEITLKEGTDHMRFAQVLRDELFGSKVTVDDAYTMSNLREEAEILHKQDIGWYIFTVVLAAVIFAVVLIILYVLLSEHMRGQRQNIALMRTLGATHKTIRHIYLRQGAVFSVIGLVLAIGLGVLFSAVLAASLPIYSYRLLFNLQTALTYALIIVVMAFAINLPILAATTKNKLQMYST